MITIPLLCAALAALPPLSAADKAVLAKACRASMEEPSAKARQALLAKQKGLIARASFAEVELLAREAVPGDDFEPGFTHGVAFTSHGAKYRYSVHCPKQRPQGLLPLVVDPGHISFADEKDAGTEGGVTTWLDLTGAREDVIYVRTRVFDQLAAAGEYEAAARANVAAGEPNLDTLAAILLDAIADACRRYPIDPDRVVVHGISMSGFWAWYAGAVAPDRFAAVVPVSAVTWHVAPLAETFRNTRVFVLHGTADAICKFEPVAALCRKLEADGFPLELRAIEGGEHVKNTFPRWNELWPAVAAARRGPPPKTVARVLHTGERPGCFWLEAAAVQQRAFAAVKPSARLAGSIEGQTVAVEAEGVSRVRVLLSTELLDPSQPVEVTVNGKSAFRGKVAPDLALALEVARARGDGGQVYSAAVEVEVPPAARGR